MRRSSEFTSADAMRLADKLAEGLWPGRLTGSWSEGKRAGVRSSDGTTLLEVRADSLMHARYKLLGELCRQMTAWCKEMQGASKARKEKS